MAHTVTGTRQRGADADVGFVDAGVEHAVREAGGPKGDHQQHQDNDQHAK